LKKKKRAIEKYGNKNQVTKKNEDVIEAEDF